MPFMSDLEHGTPGRTRKPVARVEQVPLVELTLGNCALGEPQGALGLISWIAQHLSRELASIIYDKPHPAECITCICVGCARLQRDHSEVPFHDAAIVALIVVNEAAQDIGVRPLITAKWE